LVHDGKILLGRRKGSSWYDGYYDLPAGHLEDGESLTSALRREVKEEIDVDILPKDVIFSSICHRHYAEDQTLYFNVYFRVEHWQGEPKIMEPEKSDDLRWFSLDDLPENITPATQDGLKALKAGVKFAESGF